MSRIFFQATDTNSAGSYACVQTTSTIGVLPGQERLTNIQFQR